MKYIVREPGKDGGAEFDTHDEAMWKTETGITCEIHATGWIDLFAEAANFSGTKDLEPCAFLWECF